MKRSESRTSSLSSGKKKKSGDNKLFKFLPLICLVVAIGGFIVWYLWPKFPVCPPSHEQIVYPSKPQSPKSVTIYIDNSESMKGYANGGKTDFIDALSDLYRICPITNTVYFDTSYNVHQIPDLISDLRNNRIEYQGESLLYNDLGKIASIMQKDTKSLALYVTDGILSFSNKEIQTDPEKNKDEAQKLMNLTSDAIKGKGVSVSIYQLYSPFTGTYYCYNNSKAQLNKDIRPYYVIAVGKPEYLSDLKQKIEKKSNDNLFHFKPKNQWHCIETKTINSDLSIEPVGSFDKACKDENCNNYIYDIKHINSITDPNTQTKGIIRFSIPSPVFVNYAHSIDSLKKHCQVWLDGRELKGVVNSDKHGLHIALDTNQQTLAKKSEIKILIDYFYPSWVASCSNGDDLYMKDKKRDSRTFLLEQFTHGIFNGVVGNNGHLPIYSKTIYLIQK